MATSAPAEAAPRPAGRNGKRSNNSAVQGASQAEPEVGIQADGTATTVSGRTRPARPVVLTPQHFEQVDRERDGGATGELRRRKTNMERSLREQEDRINFGRSRSRGGRRGGKVKKRSTATGAAAAGTSTSKRPEWNADITVPPPKKVHLFRKGNALGYHSHADLVALEKMKAQARQRTAGKYKATGGGFVLTTKQPPLSTSIYGSYSDDERDADGYTDDDETYDLARRGMRTAGAAVGGRSAGNDGGAAAGFDDYDTFAEGDEGPDADGKRGSTTGSGGDALWAVPMEGTEPRTASGDGGGTRARGSGDSDDRARRQGPAELDNSPIKAPKFRLGAGPKFDRHADVASPKNARPTPRARRGGGGAGGRGRPKTVSSSDSRTLRGSKSATSFRDTRGTVTGPGSSRRGGGNAVKPAESIFPHKSSALRRGPSFSLGVKLKSKKEIDIAIGLPENPAPNSYDVVSAFGASSRHRHAPSFEFGRRLPTAKERERALGIPEPPAPGGQIDLDATGFSFAAEGKRANKGAKMLGRLKSAREISISLGYPEPPAPGGLIPTSSFSFTAESARQNKGVVFGRRMKSVEEINREHAVGSGPGGSCRVPSFVHDAAVENKGPRMLGRQKTFKEMERSLGIPEPPAPGGQIDLDATGFSFVAEGKRANRGVPFGTKLPSPRTILRNIGYGETPGAADYNLSSPIVMELPPRQKVRRTRAKLSAAVAFEQGGRRRSFARDEEAAEEARKAADAAGSEANAKQADSGSHGGAGAAASSSAGGDAAVTREAAPRQAAAGTSAAPGGDSDGVASDGGYSDVVE